MKPKGTSHSEPLHLFNHNITFTFVFDFNSTALASNHILLSKCNDTLSINPTSFEIEFIAT
jgi:hypothetical protein